MLTKPRTDLWSATAWSSSCAAHCRAGGWSTALEVASRDLNSRHQTPQIYTIIVQLRYNSKSTHHIIPTLTVPLERGAVYSQESDVNSSSLTEQT